MMPVYQGLARCSIVPSNLEKDNQDRTKKLSHPGRPSADHQQTISRLSVDHQQTFSSIPTTFQQTSSRLSLSRGCLGVAFTKVLPPAQQRLNVSNQSVVPAVFLQIGNSTKNSAPPVGWLAAVTSPPMARASWRAMASPNPDPPASRLRDRSAR